MIGQNIIANEGRQIHTLHRGSFLSNLNLFCYFIGLLTAYTYFNWGRRKVNIVSHLLPVSVWSIVSREMILPPAELIPLPEESNRSRPVTHSQCFEFSAGSLGYATCWLAGTAQEAGAGGRSGAVGILVPRAKTSHDQRFYLS